MKVILVCAQACLCYNTRMEVLNQIRNQISSLILLCGSRGTELGFSGLEARALWWCEQDVPSKSQGHLMIWMPVSGHLGRIRRYSLTGGSM